MEPRLPNVVIILADDMGFGDVGCYNPDSRIPTPHMDSLAAGGRRFTDMHSPSAVCTPSRYGLLTGRYCWRSPLKRQVLYNYEPPLIESSRSTIASYLKSLGYDTACIGKWHLGLGWAPRQGEKFDFAAALPWASGSPDPAEEAKIDLSAPISGGPNELGFDTFFGVSGCATAQPPFGFIENDHMAEDRFMRYESGIPGCRSGMMAAGWRHEEADIAFTEKAVDYIKSRALSKTTPGMNGFTTDDVSEFSASGQPKPFLLYLAASAPHEPAIRDVVPEFARYMSEAGPRGDLVWLFDWIVGQVVQALEEAGQMENTLLIVTSDNGALPGHSTSIDRHAPWYDFGHASCGDWRGFKSHIWEGGHREPFIAHWPGQINPATVSSTLGSFTDILPTLAAITGGILPHGAAEDGRDISPALFDCERTESQCEKDPAESDGRRTTIVHHSVYGHFSFRRDNYKLILGSTGSGGWPPPSDGPPDPDSPGQLYDLGADPGERNNLYFSRADLVRDLSNSLARMQGCDLNTEA